MNWQKKQISRLQKSARPNGFSLVELLVVVAIAGALGTMAMVSFGGVRSGNLSSGGNLVVDLAEQARQNSISKNCMTAVVLVRDSTNAQLNKRAFILMERTSDSSWTPLSTWIFLPGGISVDMAAAESAGFQTLPDLTEPIGPLRYGGTSVSSASLVYQVFLPGGRMLDPGSTPTLRLVQDHGASANYYDIVFNVMTGVPKVIRP